MQGNRPLIVLLTLSAFVGVIYTLKVSSENPIPGGIPSKVVQVNGYPEFHVDGKPFFMHSAAFYYYRTPRDRWEECLRALQAQGINTIDLYIVWNWHQPAEGALDLDGHSNPQRDLKALLRLISGLGFKLSVRPGPFICSEWRNGGYPDWLLVRPEYRMPLKDILEGRYPFLSALQYDFSEEAASGYLSNETHLRYTRKWYQDVMALVRPYLASRGGNVIMLQVDDDQGLDAENYNGPKFWEYLNLLRQFLREAARDETIPIYFNPAGMRVTAESSNPLGKAPFWAMGQYYQEEGFGSDVLRVEDSLHAKYYTEILKTQPGFPPFFIEYQAGWFAGAEDVRARATDPTNTLLSSRFLFQNGVKGLNYFPLQDTLYPAGYECAWSNYFYSWESAIGVEGELRPRAEASIRNGALIEGMGSLLAASHYVADIGIVNTMGTYPQEKLTKDDVRAVLFRTSTALQLAQFNQVNAELVDLDYQKLEQLQRYPLLLVPALSDSDYKSGRVPDYMEFSDRAQQRMIEYVHQGGTLVAYPSPPRGRLMTPIFPIAAGERLGSNSGEIRLELQKTNAFALGPLQAFSDALTDKRVEVYARAVFNDPSGAGNSVAYRCSFGKGSTIVLGAQFDRWVPLRSASGELDASLPTQPVASETVKKGSAVILEHLMITASAKRSVRVIGLGDSPPAQQPLLSLLAANASSTDHTGSAYGFLGITNFDSSTRKISPLVRDPRNGSNLQLPELEIAGRDALTLPLRLSFKDLQIANANALEEIVWSTAEVTAVRSESGAIAFDLYSKRPAVLRLRLEQVPGAPPAIGGEKADFSYDAQTRRLDITIPAPKDSAGRQTLRIPYAGSKASPRLAVEPWNPPVDIRPTIRIPVRADVAYGLFPATQVAKASESIAFSFTHPPDCKGKCTAKVSVGDLIVSEVNAEKSPAFTLKAPADRTYIRNFEWTLQNESRPHSGTGQALFIGTGQALALERDVDRDGFNDFILENERVRIIVSPYAGARSFAFIRKDVNRSAFTSIGGMRDMFRTQMPDPPGHDRLPTWTRHGLPGMHNRPYEGTITHESGAYAEIRLAYEAPDVAPQGALLERTMRLDGDGDFVDVTYTITPREPAGDQSYINFNSIAIGSMEDEAASILISDKSPGIALKKKLTGSIMGASWVALAGKDGRDLVGLSWEPGVIERVAYDRRNFSLMLSLESPAWKSGEKSHAYKIRYLYAPDAPQARQSLMGPRR